MINTFLKSRMRLAAALLPAALLSACAMAPVTLPTPMAPEMTDLNVRPIDIPCALRVNCPSMLAYSVKSGVNTQPCNYDGKALVEEVFQKALRRRYMPHSGATGTAAIAEANVHELRINVSGSRASCTTKILCVLRDYQSTIVFKKLYSASSSSHADSSSVPPAVVESVGRIAQDFVRDVTLDPIVANSFAGSQGSETPTAVISSGPSYKIAVLPMSADSRLEQMDEMFITAFSDIGQHTVLSAADRDAIVSEQKWNNTDMVDPGEADAIRIGKLLAARYLITGSCGFLANSVSINVRVVDCETGQTVAADSTTAPFEAVHLLNAVKRQTGKLTEKWNARM